MRKALEGGPSWLYRRVRDEQTVPAGENVHQKFPVVCVKSCRRFPDPTIRFAPLDLTCKEETGVGFHQQDASRFTRNQFQEGLEQCVQNVVHAEVLRKGKSCFAKRVGLRPGRLCPVEVSRYFLFGGFSR